MARISRVAPLSYRGEVAYVDLPMGHMPGKHLKAEILTWLPSTIDAKVGYVDPSMAHMCGEQLAEEEWWT